MLRAKLNMAMAVVVAGILLVQGPGIVATPAAEKPVAPVPSDSKQEVRVKWEYKSVTADDLEKLAPKGSKDKLTDGLNALGEQGWELVTVVPGTPELRIGVGGGPGGLPLPAGGGAGGPGMLPAPKIKPNTYLFKRPK